MAHRRAVHRYLRAARIAHRRADRTPHR
jgi:hypothetical protein